MAPTRDCAEMAAELGPPRRVSTLVSLGQRPQANTRIAAAASSGASSHRKWPQLASRVTPACGKMQRQCASSASRSCTAAASREGDSGELGDFVIGKAFAEK